jgi:6-phosphogluconate dehydrogenase (decarboxylating)
MELGVIGLGKMGRDIVRRLISGGHQAVVHDQNAEAMGAVSGEGAVPAESLDDLRSKEKVGRYPLRFLQHRVDLPEAVQSVLTGWLPSETA